MEVKQSTVLGQRDFSKQVSSPRIYSLRRIRNNIVLSWLILLSVTISVAAEVSYEIHC
jgi:hypothetical protein